MNVSLLHDRGRSPGSATRHRKGSRAPFNIYLHPARIVLLSFLTVILAGAFLLSSPRATVGPALSIVDALFTATSATCVTGLVVTDTGASFSHFGQLVILFLIQIGGLGIMTLSTFFVYIFAGKLSLTEREIVQDTFSQDPMADLSKLLMVVFIFTITIEILGAALLFVKFAQDHTWPQAAYLGFFHAISAFCNAGFALFSDSFAGYRGDFYVNMVLSGLVVLGGLGFVVIFDLARARHNINRFLWRRLMFHSRVVLASTGGLLALGCVAFLALEYGKALAGMPVHDKLIASVFQSVTTRTAGFNTIDLSHLSSATLFFMMILMFIGASPGSCGGGIKTSTFVVIMASVRARFRMQEQVNIRYRRVPEAAVSRAISLVFFSSLIIASFTFALLITESGRGSNFGDLQFIDYLFEAVSAFGTVGLSTGVTGTLSETGKILVALLMFIGRLGPLTLTLAMQGRRLPPNFKYVQENILVG